METKEAKNGMIPQNVEILVDLGFLQNKTNSQNVEILVDLGFLKISRTSGCMNGDQRSQKWDDFAELP